MSRNERSPWADTVDVTPGASDGRGETVHDAGRDGRQNGGGADGDWQADAPTERQLRYIEVLGGDPSSVRTKGQAGELIDRRRRLRRGSPLDPVRLEDLATKAGRSAGGDWQSAHNGLLADLRLRIQEYVDSTMASLRTKLSNPVGSEGSSHFRNPHDLVHDAEEELTRLQLWRQHGRDVGSRGFWNAGGDGEESAASNDDASQGQSGTAESSSSESPLLDLIRWTVVLVSIESLWNIVLLRDALPGGMLGAFLLAVTVSMVNVGLFGIGVGLVLSWLRRTIGGASRLFSAACAVWALVAVGFNFLIAGRHREAYSRVVAAIQENPTEPPPLVRDILPDVPFNFLGWDFVALLFATLGLGLCCIGLWKGLTAFPDTTRHETEAPIDDEADIDNPDEELFARYESLPERYQHKVEALRAQVADWYARLDEERRNVQGTVENLREEQHRQACINFVEYSFVSSYNKSNPGKISLERVEEHRLDRYPEPLTVKPSDLGVLEEAATVGADWTDKGRSEFDEKVLASRTQIRALWKDYRPLVLGASNIEQ